MNDNLSLRDAALMAADTAERFREANREVTARSALERVIGRPPWGGKQINPYVWEWQLDGLTFQVAVALVSERSIVRAKPFGRPQPLAVWPEVANLAHLGRLIQLGALEVGA